MARIKGNVVMASVSGMFGNQVIFKERLGKPYVSAPPTVNEKRKVSHSEQGNQNRFKESTEYAQHAMQDPQLKQLYTALAKEGQTAFNAAVSDAFHPPKIYSLHTHGYKGKTGDMIFIQAKDNMKVKSVRVVIYDALNNLVEEGDAIDSGDGFNWTYITTAAQTDFNNAIVEARAYDVAGNETVRSERVG